MTEEIIIISVAIGVIIGFLVFGLYCCFVVGSRSDGDDYED